MTNDERLDLIEKQITEIQYELCKFAEATGLPCGPFTAYVKNPSYFAEISLEHTDTTAGKKDD